MEDKKNFEIDQEQKHDFVRASGQPNEAFGDRAARAKETSEAVDASKPRKRKRPGVDELCL